jgi:hypothetical protein
MLIFIFQRQKIFSFESYILVLYVYNTATKHDFADGTHFIGG